MSCQFLLLPAEVLCDITDCLPTLQDRLALQFSCKSIQTKLGTRAHEQLQNARHGNDRWEWLKRLARDLPDKDVCNLCNTLHSPLLALPRIGEKSDRICQREYVRSGSYHIIPALIVRAALRRHKQGLPWDWLVRGMLLWRPLCSRPSEEDNDVEIRQAGCVFYDFQINDNAEFVFETTVISMNPAFHERCESRSRTEQPKASTVDRDGVCLHITYFHRRNSEGPDLRRCDSCLVEYWLGYVDLDGIGRVQVLKTWKQLTWQNSVFSDTEDIGSWYAEQLDMGGISGVRKHSEILKRIEMGIGRSEERMAILREASKHIHT